MVDNSRLRSLLESAKRNVNDALAELDGTPPPPPPPPPPNPEEAPPQDAGPLLELPGTFLVSTIDNHDWIARFGQLPPNQWSKVRITYDVMVGSWDPRPERKSHVIGWLQPSNWPKMLAYLMVQRADSGTRGNAIRFRSNAAATADGSFSQNQSVTVHTGDRLRVTILATPTRLEMDVVVGDPNAGVVAALQATVPLRAGMLATARNPVPLFGLGTFETQHGPEARTYGWEFSNLRVEWTP